MSKQTNHRVENLRVLERPPGKLKGRVMVCCEAFRGLEIWQRTDFLIDRKSVEHSAYSFLCSIPSCRQPIELDTSQIQHRRGRTKSPAG